MLISPVYIQRSMVIGNHRAFESALKSISHVCNVCSQAIYTSHKTYILYCTLHIIQHLTSSVQHHHHHHITYSHSIYDDISYRFGIFHIRKSRCFIYPICNSICIPAIVDVGPKIQNKKESWRKKKTWAYEPFWYGLCVYIVHCTIQPK